MNVSRIFSGKNNKVRQDAHLFSLQEGDYLVRIEAESFGRMGGRNAWDVFYVASPGGREYSIVPDDAHYATNAIVYRYEGVDYGVRYREGLDTPLGREGQYKYIYPTPISWFAYTQSQARIVADVAILAIRDGFGPHGRIANGEDLEAWARDEIDHFPEPIFQNSWVRVYQCQEPGEAFPLGINEKEARNFFLNTPNRVFTLPEGVKIGCQFFPAGNYRVELPEELT